MSGTGSNQTPPTTNPMPAAPNVPGDPEELRIRIPEISRQILNRIAVIEGEIYQTQPARLSEMVTQLFNLQVAQTTVQQSLNLLQSGHNKLHEHVGKIEVDGAGRLPQSSKDRRILDPKNSLPSKFFGQGRQP